ncbi:hypothetical protein WJX75_008382 [Coccomyxa subellipsoidea]|uniref:Serine aminopeptidase S33 domain-containing protein n=1 Tax=Coccomyxa subellipsoidea TaxID=248742 RepID=A0ABR2YBP3_9CHLO
METDHKEAAKTPSCEEAYTINGQKLRLFSRRWKVSGQAARAAVVLVHGFSWHSAYFQELAEALSEAGYAVSTYDLQDNKGHGRSDSLLGIRGYAKSFDDHVDDLEQQVRIAHGLHEDLPVFAFGESMGGLLLLMFALRPAARDLLRGVILSAPVIAVADSVLPPKPAVAVLRFLAKLFPRTPLPSSEIKDGHVAAFGNREIALASLEDSLVLISLPFLVMHGTEDERTELKHSETLYSEARSSKKDIKRYNGAKHQLLQDTPEITAAVISDIINWLNEQVAT